MKPWVRWAILGATVVGVVILFVLLSPDDANEDPPTPTTSPTTSPSPSDDGSPTVSPTQEPPSGPTVIEVTVRGVEVRGPSRPVATQGDVVLIVVDADVSDHVHVHGYDLMDDVAPGRPARIRFTADVPGVFEVELEDAGRSLFQLEIRP
jgi:hypothetical protein